MIRTADILTHSQLKVLAVNFTQPAIQPALVAC